MMLDFICAGAALMAVWKGLSKGLILAVFSFLGFLAGLLAALKLSVVVAEWLKGSVAVNEKWLPVLAFLGVFVTVMILVRIGSGIVEGMIKVAMLGWLNKLGGVLLYLLLYALMISVLVFYAEQLQLLSAGVRNESVMYPLLQPLAPAFLNLIGLLLPVFKDLFYDLELFFQQLQQKISS